MAEALTAGDGEFIEATDRVTSDLDGNWTGYPDVPARLRVNTAHTVCDKLDGGALGAGDFIVAALDDRREHAGYFAALFQQSAIIHYCPRHSDKLGNI